MPPSAAAATAAAAAASATAPSTSALARTDSLTDLADLAKRVIVVRSSWEDTLKSVVLVGAGAGMTYATMLATGHAPLWFGPERRDWSSAHWNEHANRVLAELESDPSFQLHTPRSSDRNYVAADPDSHRRVRKVLYVSTEERKAKGVVKFGADCEGPPRHVHGGCTAATADQLLGVFVVRVLAMPVVTANLSVDYIEKIPLGSQVGFTCEAEEGSDIKKVVAKIRFYSIDPADGPVGERVFAKASAVFVNTLIPNFIKSYL